MRVRFRLANLRASHRWHHVLHTGHTWAHGIYLALVFYESHGLYGYAAGAMLVFITLGGVAGEVSPVGGGLINPP